MSIESLRNGNGTTVLTVGRGTRRKRKERTMMCMPVVFLPCSWVDVVE